MKIINYDKNVTKKEVTDKAYEICNHASFPVEYQDVYNHLFENDNLILKLLLTDTGDLKGFGVFEKYDLKLKDDLITMLYLSGMVIDPEYQHKKISHDIIKKTYMEIKSDLISLRTQNIAMAKSLLDTFNDNLFMMPGMVNDSVLEYLKTSKPFEDVNKDGIIKRCYPNQLYYDLGAIKDNFNKDLESTDALAVVIEPGVCKQKKISHFI